MPQTQTVEDLQDREDLIFVSDSQDVEPIKSSFPDAEEYDSFFVKIGEGEYIEIFGMFGIVPYHINPIYKVL